MKFKALLFNAILVGSGVGFGVFAEPLISDIAVAGSDPGVCSPCGACAEASYNAVTGEWEYTPFEACPEPDPSAEPTLDPSPIPPDGSPTPTSEPDQSGGSGESDIAPVADSPAPVCQ